MRKNNLIFARRTLYNLKRRYGAPGDLYHLTTSTQDSTTGQTTVTRIKYPIKKIIILPTTLERELNLKNESSRPSTGFPNTGLDVSTRFLIIDKRDLPLGLELDSDDYIIIAERDRRTNLPGKRYNITTAQELEDGISILLNVKFTKGGYRGEIFDNKITEKLTLNETVENQ